MIEELVNGLDFESRLGYERYIWNTSARRQQYLVISCGGATTSTGEPSTRVGEILSFAVWIQKEGYRAAAEENQ